MNIKLSAIQTNLVWENKQANLNKFALFAKNMEDTDIIVLPEMFSTGFSMNVSAMAEPMNGPTISWMCELASKKNAAVCGSIIISEAGHFYNRFIFAEPDGNLNWYNKRHLFTMGNESEYYTHGAQRQIIQFRGFLILLLICYDLRFPVWSRNCNDFDLIIYTANWPAPRRHAWLTLLQARAIENQSYVFAVNRTGEDANGVRYSGNSLAIDAKGKITAQLPDNTEGIVSEVFSLESLVQFRRKFPALNDADSFSIIK